MSKQTISRRSLIASTIAGGAAMAASPLMAHEVDNVKWDETFDVVIIGSGFAGLAAAIEAHNAGAKAVVLEKMTAFGGNSIINGGILTATGCPQQKMHKIEDSVDLLEKDILVAGQYLNDKAKVRLLAEHALSNYEWCVKTLGVEFLPDAIGQEGGHSVPRYVFTKNGSGSGIVTKELEKLKKMGVPVRLRCYVERIFRDDSGRVVGVQIREGYRFPKADSGKVKTIGVKKGLVLCYGGFSRDVDYRMMQDPKLVAKLDSTNQPGATAELWRETSRIGCAQVQNDWIQCTPWNSPKEKGMGLGWTFSQSGAAEFGLWVNTAGKRFVDELANRKVRADAIMVEQNKGLRAVAICTEANLKSYNVARPGMLKKLLESGVVKQYKTLADIAADYKMPADVLAKTVETFNKAVKDRKDPEFNRIMNPEQVPLVDGPWYAAEMSPKVHHCMGGLVTDMQCRVMDISTSKPVPGLFAAGEATSGVHGAVRLGSCAILDCLVNGRIAGQEAAKA